MQYSTCVTLPEKEKRKFFPEKGNISHVLEAQRYCIDCPVWEQCRRWDQLTDNEYGVWAGEFHTRDT